MRCHSRVPKSGKNYSVEPSGILPPQKEKALKSLTLLPKSQCQLLLSGREYPLLAEAHPFESSLVLILLQAHR